MGIHLRAIDILKMVKINKTVTILAPIYLVVATLLAPEKNITIILIAIPFALADIFLAERARIRAAARRVESQEQKIGKTMSVDEMGLLLAPGREMRKMAREVIQHREQLGVNHLLAAGGSKRLLGYSDITPILEAYGKKGMLGALKNWTLTQRGEWEDLSAYERILSLDEWTAAGKPGFKPKNPMLVG